MLERTIVSSASMWPDCSSLRSQVVKFSISYLLFLTLTSAAAAISTTALQVVLGLKLAVAFGVLRAGRRWRWEGERRELERVAELRLFHRNVGIAAAASAILPVSVWGIDWTCFILCGVPIV